MSGRRSGDRRRESIPGARLVRPLIDGVAKPLYCRYHSRRADLGHDATSEGRERVTGAPDHVLVVVVDALRPDFVPDLDLTFTWAVTPGTWTFPAVTSLHTGLYPHEHGAVAHTSADDETYAMPEQPARAWTVAHLMEAAGYRTYCGCAFFVPFLAVRGWYQRHRVYDDVRAERVLSDYLAWRSGRDRTFAYLHLGDLHAPIDPPREYVEARDVDTSLPNLERLTEYTDSYDGSDACRYFRDHRLRLYRAAVDYLEDCLSPLLARVESDTLVVLTGDHGEAHWEHHELDRRFTDSRPNYGVGHGGTPFDEVARVPLGSNAPLGTFEDGSGWPSLRDLPATLATETVGRAEFPGVSWREPIAPDRAVLCEATRYGVERKAVYRSRDVVIHSRADDVTLTARLEDGRQVFCEIDEAVRGDLRAALPDVWEDAARRSDVGRLVKRRLRALGYR